VINNDYIEIPASVKKCIDELQVHYTQLLGSDLIGIYLHGSIAMGCFNEVSSDIDVMVVVEEPLTTDIKKQLGQIHLELSATYRKNIELSVVTRETLINFVYPTPFEFHYSDGHKQSFLDEVVDFETAKQDYDLAAHFVILKTYGITLVGEQAEIMFPEISKKDYVDSITRDFEWSFYNIMASFDERNCRVPPYAVLNSCRVLAFLDSGLITSKQSGAEWAQHQLPSKFQSLIYEALMEYKNAGSSHPVEGRLLKEFAQYVRRTILELNG